MNLTEKIAFACAKNKLLPLWFRRSCRRKIRRWLRGETLLIKTSNGVNLNVIVGDDVDNQILFEGIFEPHVTGIIARLAEKDEGFFVDVGCHLGYYATLVSAINPKLSIVAFDANPEMVSRCKANLELNGVVGTVNNVGVGAKAGKLDFKFSRQHPSLGTFGKAPSIVEDVSTIEVDVMAFRDVLPEEKIYLLKMDIEGYEFDAFSSLDTKLAENIENIVFECSADRLEQCGHSPSDFDSIEWLKDYRIHLIREDHDLVPLNTFSEVPAGDQNLWLKRKNGTDDAVL